MFGLPLRRVSSFQRGRTLLRTLGFILGAMAAAPVADAQQIDSSFSATTNNEVYTVAVQSDAKILIGGYFTQANAVPRSYIARLHPDGALDTEFTAAANSYVWTLAVQPDGKILVGGTFSTFNSSPASGLVRLNPDGTRDATFTLPVNFYSQSLSIVVQPDGKILVSGYIYNGVNYTYMVRLNGNGTLDGAFAPSPNSWVRDIDLLSDGKILLAGDFTTVAGATRNHFARLNPNGSLDNGFDPNAQGGTGHAIAARPDGKVVVGGTFNFIAGDFRNRIALLNPDGTRDTTFNPNANNAVYSIQIQPDDGKAVIGGAFSAIGAANVRTLARINTDGSLDTSFVPFTAISGHVRRIVLQPDGRILAGGEYGPNTIARFLKDGTPNVPPTIVPPAALTLLASASGQQVGPFPFTVGDPDGNANNVTVTAVNTTNANIVALSSIFVQGTGANRGVHFTTGGGNIQGSTVITLRANDGLSTTDAEFTVTLGGNSPPTITAPPNQTLTSAGNSSVSTGPLAFTVSDPNSQTVTVTATSSNTGVVSNSGISFTGNGTTNTNRTLTVNTVFGSAGGTTTITLTASDGTLTATTTFTVTLGVDTGGPRNLTASVSRNLLDLSWQPPAASQAISYILDVGFSPGATAASLPMGNGLSFRAVAPDGRFFVRVRAQLAGGGASPPSNEVDLIVGGMPLAPLSLVGSTSGNAVSLQWTENPAGPAITAYQLLVGTGPGLSNIAVVPVSPNTRSISAVAPTGTYYARVRAVNASGAGPTSNEVVLQVGQPCGPPAPPTGLSATTVPGGVTIAWNAPAGSIAGYQLQAGTAPGLSNIAVIPLPAITTISGGAPSGRYYVRLVAVSACGAPSGVSSEITFVIP